MINGDGITQCMLLPPMTLFPLIGSGEKHICSSLSVRPRGAARCLSGPGGQLTIGPLGVQLAVCRAFGGAVHCLFGPWGCNLLSIRPLGCSLGDFLCCCSSVSLSLSRPFELPANSRQGPLPGDMSGEEGRKARTSQEERNRREEGTERERKVVTGQREVERTA